MPDRQANRPEPLQLTCEGRGTRQAKVTDGCACKWHGKRGMGACNGHARVEGELEQPGTRHGKDGTWEHKGRGHWFFEAANAHVLQGEVDYPGQRQRQCMLDSLSYGLFMGECT